MHHWMPTWTASTSPVSSSRFNPCLNSHESQTQRIRSVCWGISNRLLAKHRIWTTVCSPASCFKSCSGICWCIARSIKRTFRGSHTLLSSTLSFASCTSSFCLRHKNRNKRVKRKPISLSTTQFQPSTYQAQMRCAWWGTLKSSMQLVQDRWTIEWTRKLARRPLRTAWIT